MKIQNECNAIDSSNAQPISYRSQTQSSNFQHDDLKYQVVHYLFGSFYLQKTSYMKKLNVHQKMTCRQDPVFVLFFWIVFLDDQSFYLLIYSQKTSAVPKGKKIKVYKRHIHLHTSINLPDIIQTQRAKIQKKKSPVAKVDGLIVMALKSLAANQRSI